MGCFESYAQCSWSSDRQIDRSLKIAVCGGDQQKVVRLVQLGADVNSGSAFSPLFAAVSQASVDIVVFLLEHGANPNMSRRGTFPLHVATANGRWAVVQMLLKYGALPDARREDGTTPLMIASQTGNVDIAHSLLAYGASALVQRASDGFTALHIVSGSKQKENRYSLLVSEETLEDPFVLIASLCIEDVCMYNGPTAAHLMLEQESHAGQTALSIAINNEHGNIADLLMKVSGVLRNDLPPSKAGKTKSKKNVYSTPKPSLSSDLSVSSRHALIGNRKKSLNCIKWKKSVVGVFNCWR